MKIGIDIGTKDHTAVMLTDPPPAWVDVLTERQRQHNAEGWTLEHDDAHEGGEMARAAAAYVLWGAGSPAGPVTPLPGATPELLVPGWPWPADWWKPTTRRRDLVKAGALILAEIERLDRAEAAKGKGGSNG